MPEDLLVCRIDSGWKDDGKIDDNTNKRKYAEKETENENYESEDFGALMSIEKVLSGCAKPG